MRAKLLGVLLAALVSSPAVASAAPSVPSAPTWGDDDDAAAYGEVHVNMNSDYAKVRVGDQDWEAVEYERNGKRALIKGIELSELPLTITLTPTSDESLGPVSFEVVRKDFKRKRVSKVWLLVAKKSVKFVKRAKPSPAPKAPEKPADKPAKRPTPGDAPDDL